jgi:hypothetical protein
MTSYVDFVPSAVAPFQFQAQLDGQPYNVIVTANLFRSSNNSVGAFYINVYDLSGDLIVCRAIGGSAVGQNLASLSWASGKVTATTQAPHGFKIARIVTLTISGASPDGYNETFPCLATSPTTFTYPLATTPGMATVPGTASFNVNLIGGYFQNSSLVFRTSNRQFEVSP